MIVKYVGKAERIIGSSTENIERLRSQAEGVDAVFIEKAIRLISEYINLGRYSERPRILLETAAVRLAAPKTSMAAVPQAVRERPAEARPAGKERPAAHAAAPVPEDDPPADEALADMIAAAPREQSGDPGGMWDLIVREMSASDRSFMGLIGRNSVADGFDAGELTVTVSPVKLSFAEDMKPEINRVAKALFGPDIYVNLKGGEIRKSASHETNNGISEDETSRIINEDISVSEVMEDVEDLFGIKPVMEN